MWSLFSATFSRAGERTQAIKLVQEALTHQPSYSVKCVLLLNFHSRVTDCNVQNLAYRQWPMACPSLY